MAIHWRRTAVRLALASVGLAATVAGAGWVYERLSERAEARLPPLGARIDVGGRRMHLTCLGQGSPTVVLEPGAGDFALVMRPLQRRVAAFTRACAYDRAGYGWSDPAPTGRSIDARASDLVKLLHRAGENSPYVLVGSSYGGLLVRSFTRQAPQSVSGMVLVDAAEERVVFEHLPLLRRAAAQQRMMGVLAEFGVMRPLVGAVAWRSRAEGRLPAEISDADLALAVAFTARPSTVRTAQDEAESYEATPDLERGPGGFGTLGDRPLVVIRHGRPFDQLNAALSPLESDWAAGQTRLAALSTNSRQVLATHDGHNIALEDPDLVSGAVREVVQSVRRRQRLGR